MELVECSSNAGDIIIPMDAGMYTQRRSNTIDTDLMVAHEI